MAANVRSNHNVVEWHRLDTIWQKLRPTVRLESRRFDIIHLNPPQALRGTGCTLAAARGGDANGKQQRKL